MVVQKLRQKHALNILLSIAQLPRATFYYHLKRINSADKYKAVKAEITAIYHENKGRYGYRRITTELHKRNFLLNHKTVQRLMKELGLVCRVRMKKYRSYKGEVGKIAPNLLNRDFHAEKPNQKWVTDVTEFSLFGEKLYLSPILDLHSNDLVSYTISSVFFQARCRFSEQDIKEKQPTALQMRCPQKVRQYSEVKIVQAAERACCL